MVQNIAKTVLTIVACFFIFFALQQEIDFCKIVEPAPVEDTVVKVEHKYWVMYRCGKYLGKVLQENSRLTGFSPVSTLADAEKFFEALKTCGVHSWGQSYNVQVLVFNSNGVIVKKYSNLNTPNPYIVDK